MFVPGLRGALAPPEPDPIAPFEVVERGRRVEVRIPLGWVVPDSIAVDCGPHTLRVAYDLNLPNLRDLAGAVRVDSVRRTIALPCEVRPELALARYRRGMLTVEVPVGEPRVATPPFP